MSKKDMMYRFWKIIANTSNGEEFGFYCGTRNPNEIPKLVEDRMRSKPYYHVDDNTSIDIDYCEVTTGQYARINEYGVLN